MGQVLEKSKNKKYGTSSKGGNWSTSFVASERDGHQEWPASNSCHHEESLTMLPGVTLCMREATPFVFFFLRTLLFLCKRKYLYFNF